MKSKTLGLFLLSAFPVFSLEFSAAGADPQTEEVKVSVSPNRGSELSSSFLGLSYESSILLPEKGGNYFSPENHALVNLFKTLGIKDLRIGANGVDDPRFPVPQEKEIDPLFDFARAAGVKVIYSFRLKKGDPAESARLATYINAHYNDLLDSFSIGNEPEYYLKKYEDYFKVWKPHYDAILQAVPQAKIDAPSSGTPGYVRQMAHDLFPEGHLSMVSAHRYFVGGGRQGEKDPAATRAKFLSNALDLAYEKDESRNAGPLMAQGIPYRFDEMNSCYNGGSKGSSDTYTSTLWALDCTHWWAAHGILGLNFHTGDSVGRDGGFSAPHYAAFVRQPTGGGFIIEPQAYGLLAFTQAAQGSPVRVKVQKPADLNFTAYAYQSGDGSYTLTLINKSFGDQGVTASIALTLPTPSGTGLWQRLDLKQADQDITAQTGITLGGSEIDSQGNWSGTWAAADGSQAVEVAPASATLLRFTPAK